MHRLFYYALRTYVWLGLHFYFRQLRVSGTTSIPRGAVLFAANHQNAFLDALLMVCTSHRYTHFLTRADIFRKGWAKKMLSLINLIPIYRIRDGWHSLGENQKTFDRCTEILLKEEALIIFPEGNHGWKRQLRPLSKGFTRALQGALEQQPQQSVHVVPVGINYTEHEPFRTSVHVVYGAAFVANDFFRPGDPASALALRDALTQRMQPLITHIPDEHYDHVYAALESTQPNYLDPAATNSTVASLLRRTAAPPKPQAQSTRGVSYRLWRVVHVVPILIWSRIRRKIKDPVFAASVKFAFGIFVVPVWQLLLAGTVAAVAGGWAAVACWCVLLLWSYMLPHP
ncbi:MAG: 1-acyl-sn-glycerol-3-phosphate acyltransferase [Cyclobacteriaceae bacterium]|jgi:1-acyl-sn-glycerol-3-phosphate acyltransferase